MTEAQLQTQVAQFLKLALKPPSIFTASVNAGKRTRWERGLALRTGMRAGWPDLEIVWCGGTGFIELKTRTGKLSGAQRVTLDALTACGQRVAVCRSLEAVEATLTDWGVPLRCSITKKETTP